MVATKGQRIAMIVLSGLKITVGIILMILCKYLFEYALALLDESIQIPFTAWWLFGLPFMVPAPFGILAAALKKDVLIGVYMALNIIVLLLTGAFAILSFILMIATANAGQIHCAEVGDVCLCSINGQLPQPVDVGDCKGVEMLYSIASGTSAMIVCGWLLCLAGSILSCSACCCPRTVSVIYVEPSAIGPTVSVHTSSAMAYGPAPVPAQRPSDRNIKEDFRYNRLA